MTIFSDLSGPYTTVVADPPWPYPSPGGHLTSSQDHRPNSFGTGAPSAAQRYSLMTMDDLKAMPVQDVVADDAHLYLWTTNAFLVEAHDLAVAWGFRPVTMLTWCKTHQDDPSRVSMKTGHYFRGATEHALFAVRGSLPLQTTEALPTAYLWPRIGEHSAKPDAFLDLVEKASPGPYLELFCRRPRLGWDAWGKGYEITRQEAS